MYTHSGSSAVCALLWSVLTRAVRIYGSHVLAPVVEGRGIEKDGEGPTHVGRGEDEEEETIQHHGDVAPVSLLLHTHTTTKMASASAAYIVRWSHMSLDLLSTHNCIVILNVSAIVNTDSRSSTSPATNNRYCKRVSKVSTLVNTQQNIALVSTTDVTTQSTPTKTTHVPTTGTATHSPNCPCCGQHTPTKQTSYPQQTQLYTVPHVSALVNNKISLVSTTHIAIHISKSRVALNKK